MIALKTWFPHPLPRRNAAKALESCIYLPGAVVPPYSQNHICSFPIVAMTTKFMSLSMFWFLQVVFLKGSKGAEHQSHPVQWHLKVQPIYPLNSDWGGRSHSSRLWPSSTLPPSSSNCDIWQTARQHMLLEPAFALCGDNISVILMSINISLKEQEPCCYKEVVNFSIFQQNWSVKNSYLTAVCLCGW